MESVFLFLWAVVSNAKEFIVDYTTELVHNYMSTTPKTKEEIDLEQKARRKKKLAYFRRMKRQMGVISPDKKSTADSKLEPTSKLDNLENELLQLKMELSAFSKPKSESAPLNIPPPPPLSMLESRAPSTVKSSATSSIPLPPPLPMSSSSSIPPPPVSLLTQPKEKSAQKNNNIPNPIYGSGPNFASPKPQKQQPQEGQRMSVADMIKSASASGIALKSTNVDRSPNGTPLKKKAAGSSVDLQSELFAAIRSKFHAVNKEKVETDSDSDFSPVRKPMHKPAAKEVEDKENQSPVRTVSSLLKKFGGKPQQTAASPLQERRSVNV